MDVDQRLEPRESQIHQLRVEMISPTDQIGSLVIEYRFNFLLNIPLIIK